MSAKPDDPASAADRLTHLGAHGEARMVDVSVKPATSRVARAEGRVSLERILDRMRDIRLDEEHHGPPSARRFRYEPTWVLRGLSDLHLTFTAAGGDR